MTPFLVYGPSGVMAVKCTDCELMPQPPIISVACAWYRPSVSLRMTDPPHVETVMDALLDVSSRLEVEQRSPRHQDLQAHVPAAVQWQSRSLEQPHGQCKQIQVMCALGYVEPLECCCWFRLAGNEG